MVNFSADVNANAFKVSSFGGLADPAVPPKDSPSGLVDAVDA